MDRQSASGNVTSVLISFFTKAKVSGRTIFYSSLPNGSVGRHVSSRIESTLGDDTIGVTVLSRSCCRDTCYLGRTKIL